MELTGNTIDKTIMMGFLFARFWDRWVANGLKQSTVSELRYRIYKLDNWLRILSREANAIELEAADLLNQSMVKEAKVLYRIAGLHYSIIQWMFPRAGDEKRSWYESCKEMHRIADSIEEDEISYKVLRAGGGDCYGRIRMPMEPRGCVIIINPLDSSKEELYSLEEHFAKRGFATIVFDGPGQGETYVTNEYQASHDSWSLFMDQIIEFAMMEYPQLDLFLFGTGSGAAWAIQGSQYPKIRKTSAVSPVFDSDIRMPDYFMERLANITGEKTSRLTPSLESVKLQGPIFLVHGNKDTIVKSDAIQEIYNRLPEGKQLAVYDDEDHCCSYRTGEIVRNAADWFLK